MAIVNGHIVVLWTLFNFIGLSTKNFIIIHCQSSVSDYQDPVGQSLISLISQSIKIWILHNNYCEIKVEHWKNGLNFSKLKHIVIIILIS